MTDFTLILGGARCGKSRYGEQLGMESGRRKLYLATAEAWDDEMHARIAQHRARREGWETVEEPLAIADILATHTDAFILVDCLTLWLSNLLHHNLNTEEETARLLKALRATQSQVALISNEVGLGLVPDNALARRFRDAAGILHQQLAAQAKCVVWMVAGIPTVIKG